MDRSLAQTQFPRHMSLPPRVLLLSEVWIKATSQMFVDKP